MRGGIGRALSPDRDRYYSQFREQYLAVRHAEGRGSEKSEYYLALPYADLSGKFDSQWAIRGRSYRYFERKILQQREARLDVLDLGAGVGWLCYRLASRGHRPVAVDLIDDTLDGLAAAGHYFSRLDHPFPRFQAEFERLPFDGGQFDLVIFNASFHYSVDYAATLQETRRVLRAGGQVVIIDTPIYARPAYGEQMREERHVEFESRFGFRSDSVPSIEFLDLPALAALKQRTGVRWKFHRPWYGWGWHLRPLRAWLGRKRPPSRFWILEGSWDEL